MYDILMSTLEWLKVSLAQILIKFDTFSGDFEPHGSYNKDSDKKKAGYIFRHSIFTHRMQVANQKKGVWIMKLLV